MWLELDCVGASRQFENCFDNIFWFSGLIEARDVFFFIVKLSIFILWKEIDILNVQITILPFDTQNDQFTLEVKLGLWNRVSTTAYATSIMRK